MRYREIISEGRDALLYHGYSEIKYAVENLTSGKMAATTTQRFWADGRRRTREDDPDYEDSYWMKGVSFTRDMQYAMGWGSVVIAVSQAKLTQRTKVIPLNWGYSNAPLATHKREREEFAVVKATKDTYKFAADDDENPGGLDINRFLSKTGVEGYLPLAPILEGVWLDALELQLNQKYPSTSSNIDAIVSHPKFKGYYDRRDSLRDPNIQRMNDKSPFIVLPPDTPLEKLLPRKV